MSHQFDTLTTVKLDVYPRQPGPRSKRSELHLPHPAGRPDHRLERAFDYEIFEELDESGARKDRPMLMRAIERVERGQSDGIVVAKLDRFGRSLVDGLQLIDRIQDAGGTFASVQDGFDLRTDTGRLVRRIMLTPTEFEALYAPMSQTTITI